MKKTNYSNPEIMKEITRKAKEDGIFAIGINPKEISDRYKVKVNLKNYINLNFLKKYKYKLVQINYELGLSKQIKYNSLKIKEIKKTLIGNYIFEIVIKTIKDKSQRAWDKVEGKPLKLFFQDKGGFIEIINLK